MVVMHIPKIQTPLHQEEEKNLLTRLKKIKDKINFNEATTYINFELRRSNTLCTLMPLLAYQLK
ncbi:294_t:CDS:1, partial [Gigaspora rosea]